MWTVCAGGHTWPCKLNILIGIPVQNSRTGNTEYLIRPKILSYFARLYFLSEQSGNETIRRHAHPAVDIFKFGARSGLPQLPL